MNHYAFGINFQTAPVSEREAFALNRDQKQAVYGEAALSSEAEFVVLSTCNRTEVYLYGSSEDGDRIRSVVAGLTGRTWSVERGFSVENESMVRHVLQVTSGLKSQVLGDAHILNQVKEAYRLAAEKGAIGPVLHRLMHSAFRTAKRVFCETAVSRGNATISALAVTAARDMLGGGDAAGLLGRKVLLLGAGEMGTLALKALKHYEPSSLRVCNRSSTRASFIAQKTGAVAVDWEHRSEAIAQSDLVIVATGADAYVLRAEEVRPRSNDAALIIDIAMPRNVDPAIAHVPGYHLVDLDGLKQWRDDLEETRRADLPRAEAICDEELTEYVNWVINHESLKPAVDALRDTFEAIRIQEIERHSRRFSDADRAELDRITRSIMQKVLSIPIVRIKEAALDGMNLSQRIQLLNALFARPGCEDPSAKDASSYGSVTLSADDALSDITPGGRSQVERTPSVDERADS